MRLANSGKQRNRSNVLLIEPRMAAPWRTQSQCGCKPGMGLSGRDETDVPAVWKPVFSERDLESDSPLGHQFPMSRTERELVKSALTNLNRC